MSNHQNYGGLPDIELAVPYGAYSKGHNWKIWSRMAGGGVVLCVLFAAVGAVGGAIACLFFILIVTLPLTAKTGLSLMPRQKEVGRPGGGLIGLGWRIHDPIGDVFLVFVWNLIRRFVSKRF